MNDGLGAFDATGIQSSPKSNRGDRSSKSLVPPRTNTMPHSQRFGPDPTEQNAAPLKMDEYSLFNIYLEDLHRTKGFARQPYQAIRVTDPKIRDAYKSAEASDKGVDQKMEMYLDACQSLVHPSATELHTMTTAQIQDVIGIGQRLMPYFDDVHLKLSYPSIRNLMEFQESLLLALNECTPRPGQSDPKLDYCTEVGTMLLAEITFVICALTLPSSGGPPTSRSKRSPQFRGVPLPSECLRNGTIRICLNALFRNEPTNPLYQCNELAGRVLPTLIIVNQCDPQHFEELSKDTFLPENLEYLNTSSMIQRTKACDYINEILNLEPLDFDPMTNQIDLTARGNPASQMRYRNNFPKVQKPKPISPRRKASILRHDPGMAAAAGAAAGTGAVVGAAGVAGAVVTTREVNASPRRSETTRRRRRKPTQGDQGDQTSRSRSRKSVETDRSSPRRRPHGGELEKKYSIFAPPGSSDEFSDPVEPNMYNMMPMPGMGVMPKGKMGMKAMPKPKGKMNRRMSMFTPTSKADEDLHKALTDAQAAGDIKKINELVVEEVMLENVMRLETAKAHRTITETALKLGRTIEAGDESSKHFKNLQDVLDTAVSVAEVSPLAALFFTHNLIVQIGDPQVLFNGHDEVANEFVRLMDYLTSVNYEGKPCVDGEENLVRAAGINVDMVIGMMESILRHYKTDEDGLNEDGEEVGGGWFSLDDEIPPIIVRLKDKVTEPITLKNIWFNELIPFIQENGPHSLVIQGNPKLRSIFEETRSKVNRLYNLGDAIGIGSADFEELGFGNIILQSWAKVPQNFDFLIRKGVVKSLLDSLAKLKRVELQQQLLVTVAELLKCDRNDVTWTMGDNQVGDTFNRKDLYETHYAQIILANQENETLFLDLIRQGIEFNKKESVNQKGLFSWEAIEAILIPRIDCLRMLATYVKTNEKTFKADEARPFDNDYARETIIMVWDYYDEEVVGQSYRTRSQIDDLFKAQKRAKEIELEGAGAATARGPKAPEDKPILEASPLDRRKSMFLQAEVNAGTSTAEKKKAIERANAQLQADLAGFKNRNQAAPVDKGRRGSVGGMARRMSMMGMGGAPKPAMAPSPFAPNKLGAEKAAVMNAGAMQRRMSMVPMTGGMSKSEQEGKARAKFVQDAKAQQRVIRAEEHGEELDDVFVAQIMHYLFGCMRVMLSMEWIPTIDEHGLIYRYLALLIDPETPPGCYANLLFCIGVISYFREAPKYKADIGEHGIEFILALIERAYQHDGLFVSDTVSNSHIALASLVIQHDKNQAMYLHHGGIRLLVDVFRVRGKMGDDQSINAAAALASNLCYKHLAMKETLGEAYLCESMLGAVANYDFMEAKNKRKAGGRIQDIAAVFKAIGNMALNDNNMDRFLALEPYNKDKKRLLYLDPICNDIVDVYARFLTYADSLVDEKTMEASMATLSNLVIDYNHMHLFVKLVTFVLQLLRREQHCSIMLHKYLFDTIANMSRQSVNAKCFGDNDGIPTIITTLPFLDRKSYILQASVVHCLGVLTNYPENIRILVDKPNYIFHWLNVWLNGYREHMTMMKENVEDLLKLETSGGGVLLMTTLPLNIMRCATRLMVDFWATREAFTHGFFDTLFQCLIYFKKQGMLVYEACRCIMTAIDRYTEEFQKNANRCKPLTDPEKMELFEDCEEVDWQQFEINEEKLYDSYLGELKDDDPVDRSLLMDKYIDIPPWRLMQKDNIRKDAPLTADQRMAKFRQKGERPWQMIGMCKKDVRVMISCIRECLADPQNHTNLRLTRTGLGTMAYFSCEKIGFDALFKRLKAVDKDVVVAAPVAAPKVAGLMRRMSMAVGVGGPGAKPKMGAKPKIVPKAKVEVAPKMIQRRQSLFVGAKKAEDRANAEWSDEIKKRNKIYRVGYGKFRPNDEASLPDIMEVATNNFYHDIRILQNLFLLLANCNFAALGDIQCILSISSWQLLEVFKKRIMTYEDHNLSADQQLSNIFGQDIRMYSRLLKSGGGSCGVDSLDAAAKGFEVALNRGDETARPQLEKKKSMFKANKEETSAAFSGTFRLLNPNDIAVYRYPLAEDRYNFVRSGHREDPFPDGVYSLNLERDRNKGLKNLAPDLLFYLRHGGFTKHVDLVPNPKTQILEPEIKYIKWKSSHDLNILEWKIMTKKEYALKKKVDNDPTYPFSCPVTRILKFYREISYSPKITEHSLKLKKSVTDLNTLVIHIPIMAAWPQGLRLDMIFEKTQHRDVHTDLFSKWRESASYGFRG